MDEVLLVGIGELLRLVMFDLGKDDGGEGAGAGAGGGSVFGEDGSAVGYAGAVGCVSELLVRSHTAIGSLEEGRGRGG